mmetsp:Transcript_14436/g.22274  ORF Transcript_14436/g.22274 Transcript_14436/m.22274 type:complete len:372 (-) Transcript_14436:62-1177(-)
MPARCSQNTARKLLSAAVLIIHSVLNFAIASVHSTSTWRPKSIRAQHKHYIRRGLLQRGGSFDEQGDVTNTTEEQPLLHSIYSIRGERQYMEDEYFIGDDGRFAAVFDGHGGAAVSRYLRQNLYAAVQAALPTSASAEAITEDESLNSASADDLVIASAVCAAFEKIDNEVQDISHWSFQGSTGLAVVIHTNIDGTRTIISGNVGDSRAILGRHKKAIDLTRDHKPNDEMERSRIIDLGGTVDWCGQVDRQGQPVEHTGVYRINGNLALSRSIGDRSERPWVTSEVEIKLHKVEDDVDSFVLLATDGLFDVMSSQEVVSYVHHMLDSTPAEYQDESRRNIAKAVTEEALRRGSSDNVTVLVIWLHGEVKDN